MKIIITSDLHYEKLSSIPRIKVMVEEIKQENPDAVILAGDLGEGDDTFEKCLELFQGLDCPVGVIAGNHDLWCFYSQFDSEELWSQVFPSITKEMGFIWMENENIYLDNIAIVGSINWYDYSYKNPEYELSPTSFFDKFHKENWSDGQYMKWDRTNVEFANEVVDGFMRRVDEAETMDNITDIVAVSHVPFFREQSYGLPNDNKIGDSFFYNTRAGELLTYYNKVKYVVSGHTHRGRSRQIGDLHLMTVDSDYGYPKYIMIEI